MGFVVYRKLGKEGDDNEQESGAGGGKEGEREEEEKDMTRWLLARSCGATQWRLAR